jgi:hypothetical protein
VSRSCSSRSRSPPSCDPVPREGRDVASPSRWRSRAPPCSARACRTPLSFEVPDLVSEVTAGLDAAQAHHAHPTTASGEAPHRSPDPAPPHSLRWQSRASRRSRSARRRSRSWPGSFPPSPSRHTGSSSAIGRSTWSRHRSRRRSARSRAIPERGVTTIPLLCASSAIAESLTPGGSRNGRWTPAATPSIDSSGSCVRSAASKRCLRLP